MILVYFVAGVSGYQVRSLDFGLSSTKDFLLKSNLPSQLAAMRYAWQWVLHTGRKLDPSCFIVRFPCFPRPAQDVQSKTKVLLAATQDDRIYGVRPVVGQYEGFKSTLSQLLGITGVDLEDFVRVLNSKGHIVWLIILLCQCKAYFDRADPKRPLLQQWKRT